jgi:hypothetical protein
MVESFQQGYTAQKKDSFTASKSKIGAAYYLMQQIYQHLLIYNYNIRFFTLCLAKRHYTVRMTHCKTKQSPHYPPLLRGALPAGDSLHSQCQPALIHKQPSIPCYTSPSTTPLSKIPDHHPLLRGINDFNIDYNGLLTGLHLIKLVKYQI